MVLGMPKSYSFFGCKLFVETSPIVLTAFFLLIMAVPSFAAELTIDYEVVARSGSTSIPGGAGAFTGFGTAPAIDSDGNVVFTGTGGPGNGGSFQSGVYTSIGVCCQRVADRSTLVPGGGGATFDVFRGADRNDIDDGRVAFTADISSTGTLLGVYSNVGQASASNLVELAVADGSEWGVISDPWVDGDEVAMRGQRLIPDVHNAILVWDGADSFVDPGAGYVVSPNTQASISAGVSVFRRYQPGSSQLGVSQDGVYDALVTLNSTPIPGHAGVTFSNVNNYPVVDWGGLDVAFRGTGSGGVLGLYKQVDGGALEQIADNATVVPGGGVVPGAGDQIFTLFLEDAMALAEGQVVFWAEGLNSLEGIYTDIGGELAVILDDEDNNTIMLDGVPEQVTSFAMSHKALALTPWGYMAVFKATLATGEQVIIRATIDVAPGGGNDNFTVYKDFSDNNTAWVNMHLSCSSGTVTNSPQLAREGTPAVFTINGASPGATCTATESVPSGYTANQADCQNGDPLNGSCTIVNTPDTVSGTFTVYKDFSDNSPTWVNIHLSCSNGTVTNSPQLAREGSPAVFTITGASPGTTCTATEPWVPEGYTKNESGCQDGDLLNSSCTIINTLVAGSDTFTVNKNFIDNNPASVSVTLSCSSGSVTNNPQPASEASPAVFNISGAAPGATCTAVESVPSGYSANQTDCQNGDPLNGSCTIFNTPIPSSDSFTVYKDFSDNNPASVSVTLSCSSGSVTNNPQPASEASSAVFNISGAAPGATCTAVESVPSGYSANQTDLPER